jgi:hypothetical protein
MYKKYLIKSFLIFLIIMSTIGIINFIIDPGNIYLKKIIADFKSAEFSTKLLNSRNGLIQTGWNERLIKTTLAEKSANFDCVILGSSHIMQISSVRNTGNIKKQCEKLLNLGVSGGSIEDISIFSYIILKNTKFPKKVFIDIDPWTLKFGMDSRYAENTELYDKMNVLLKVNENKNNISYINKITSNLFNGEYLIYSLEELFNNEKGKESISTIFSKNIIFPTNEFSYNLGYTEAVTLPDGSHIYNMNWILKQKINNYKIPMGGGDYKISGEIYDKKAIDYLKKLIDYFKQNKIEVNLILTPYHPNVFKKGNTKPVEHFTVVESIVKKFGENNNLKVYGSFFPNNIGCKNEEFFDFMHPTNECLSRIDFSK